MSASPLARILFVVYALLTAYASLYPLAGWRDHGLSPFAWLGAPWPRHFTRFDLAVNFLGYLPLGFLGVAALRPRLRGAAAFAAVSLAGLALSLALETLQSYLQTRFSSNLDLAANLAGAVAGAAAGLRFAPALLDQGPFRRLRAHDFLPGVEIDLGLALLALWLFTQLNPAAPLFALGDVRELLFVPDARARQPEFFIAIEALTAGANLLAVALLFSALCAPGVALRLRLALFVAAALAVKAAAFAILMRAEDLLAWLTPGAQLGLAAGLVAALAAVAAPRVARLAAAAVLIMAATVLVNLAPPNPYLAASLKVWQQGHFLNFNGLTRLVSALWPFAALGYLIWLASRRR